MLYLRLLEANYEYRLWDNFKSYQRFDSKSLPNTFSKVFNGFGVFSYQTYHIKKKKNENKALIAVPPASLKLTNL